MWEPPSPQPTAQWMLAEAKQVLASLPAQFADQLNGVVVDVTEFATPEQLASVGLEDRWELSGLYEGVPLPERSVWESGVMPARIWLFRQVLLAEAEETGVALPALVRHVTIHEAGHHFGLSDEDMEALEQAE